MARQALNSRKVETAKPGKYADGKGLTLIVSPTGSRKWVLRFQWQGRAREMGLGAAEGNNLSLAREKAAAARLLIAKGIDPIAERKTATVPTFGTCADAFIAAKQSEWRNDKHKAQWAMTLAEYAGPLRSKPVDTIDTAAVLAVLNPIWQDKPETASRLRGRIEHVLDAARAAGHRTGENPARWRGHLDKLLPKRAKLTRGHHAAMPYQDVPAFMASLRGREAMAAKALEFAILTAARTGEVIGAKWSEIDLQAKVWTIPAERMKAGREHRVPLSGAAFDLLIGLAAAKTGDFVFPGTKGKPLSNMAMDMVLRRMKLDVTVHGFRSSFRDWAGNETSFPREIAEAALAHVVGDATERAYRRGDALEKRRALMEAWASYVANGEGKIIKFVGRSA
jgi:integrase